MTSEARHKQECWQPETERATSREYLVCNSDLLTSDLCQTESIVNLRQATTFVR